MKRLVLMAFVVFCSALGVTLAVRHAAARAPDEKPVVAPPGSLIVHEWGTFTGFAGSDGAHLPFNSVVGSDLPAFVENRQRQASREDPKLQIPMIFSKGGGIAALQRMETPVLYFYAQQPRDISVRVDFPQGTLTEFYPPVKAMGPRWGRGFGETVSLPPTTQASAGPTVSFLDWGTVRVAPRQPTGEGPAVPGGSRYAFARNTDSALVQSGNAGAMSYEKFLFYRGLGNFTLPLTLRALGNDRFEIKNSATAHLSAAFLIQVNDIPSKTCRFVKVEDLGERTSVLLSQDEKSQEDLSRAIADGLIREGLYPKEALAMVQTWKSTWLDEPGTRLLYLVPRSVTDTLLPLHITPTPDQTVRVLVGRLDVLTPEREARLQAMLLSADPSQALSDADARVLKSLGRFWLPAIKRASALAGDTNQQKVERLVQSFARVNTPQK